MLDLYQLPQGFPGFKSVKEHSDPYERVSLLENSFAEDISNKRFIPYIQLHEFEALFFSDIYICNEVLSLNSSNRITELEAILKKQPNPELLNGGAQSAPSKRILKNYPQYQKSIDGIRILERIGLPNIRKKCHHFDNWLIKLESINKILYPNST